MMVLGYSLSSWKKGLFVALGSVVLLLVVYYAQTGSFFDNRNTKLSYWTEQIKLSTSRTVANATTSNYGFSKMMQTKSSTGKTPGLDDQFGKVNFDINGSDVMVFLHMQKTGGTGFGKKLIRNMNLSKECDILEGRKRRNCLRPNSDIETWIFSRYSTGWLCGLHSDWTELHECLADKLNEIEKIYKERRFFYVTILRDPINRFISEWKHVQRGATWSRAKFSCNHKQNSIPNCYSGNNWEDATLKEFMSCHYNMGINRQTRMIADLRLVNCYQRWLDQNATSSQIEDMENTILESAKRNLKNLTFFGLLEDQRRMQQLFEFTFPFKFKSDFVQDNETRISEFEPTEEELDAMTKLNYLDVELYDYAKQLFDERYRRKFQK